MLKEKVFTIVRTIPRGRVTTYKEVAKALGNPRLARAVGNALNKNPEPDRVPCFRVVRSNGEVGGFALGKKEKIQRLKRDGIEVKNGKIDLKRYFF